MNNSQDISGEYETMGSGNTPQFIVPKTLIHEVSSALYYIGISENGSNTLDQTWSIRKIELINDVWATALYPNGDQGFNYAWENRLVYDYL